MSLIDAEAVPESKTATQAATKTAKQETKSAGGTVAALPPLFGEVNGSPLHIPIIGICGAKGSGKTLAAILLDPENTTLADIEDSSVTYNVPLAKRYSLYAEVKTKNPSGIPTPIECWLWFAGLIESGKITTRIMCVDPISDLQQGLVDWVRSNPEKFGRTETQYAKASGLLWADVKSHLKMTLGRLSRQVECFIFTSHMGTVWSGSSPVVGKMKAKGVDTFYELASLYLHLHRNVDPKTGKQPAAPVASIAPPIGKSRLARITFGKDGEIKTTPILPPRMKDFSLRKIKEYVANGPDYNKLAAHQRAESQELTEDERLQLSVQKAELERDTEELRSSRMDAAKSAAKRNAAAKAAAASQATATNTASSAAAAETEPKNDPVDVPDSEDLVTEKAAKKSLAVHPESVEQGVTMAKAAFKALKMTKAEMVAEIWRHSSKGKKLAELSLEQITKLLHALDAKQMLVDSFAKK